MQKSFDQHVFKNYISTHLGNFNIDIERSYRSRYYLWTSYLFDMLPRDHGARILEIGSGMGHNLYALRKMGYKHIFGFDISKKCVQFCKKMKFHMLEYPTVASLVRHTQSNQKFDFIIMYDLIEHFDPEGAQRLLIEVKRLLHDKGQLLISNPNGEFPFNSPVRYIDITHKFLYTASSLSQLLRIVGMKVSIVRSTPSFTLRDDNWFRQLVKTSIMFPLSIIADYLLRLFLLCQGMKLRYSKPQLFCLSTLVN